MHELAMRHATRVGRVLSAMALVAAGSVVSIGATVTAAVVTAPPASASATYTTPSATCQTYTVDSNVEKLHVTVRGGNGAKGSTSGRAAGLGGKVIADVLVSPFQAIGVLVGGNGNGKQGGIGGGGKSGADNDDHHGGGGGGASELLSGGCFGTPLVIAGGGGGAGEDSKGGSGGNAGGPNGSPGGDGDKNDAADGSGGGGGTQTEGGAGGAHGHGTCTGADGHAGASGQGGASHDGAGGGGGGYFGGGAGGSDGCSGDDGGGGGGSNYVIPTADNVTNTASGDGPGIIIDSFPGFPGALTNTESSNQTTTRTVDVAFDYTNSSHDDDATNKTITFTATAQRADGTVETAHTGSVTQTSPGAKQHITIAGLNVSKGYNIAVHGTKNGLTGPDTNGAFRVAQAITFTSSKADAVVGGTTYKPAATGGASGNPVTFAIDSSSSSNCSISSGTVSFTGAGSCKINAAQIGNADYDPAAASQTITVGKGNTTFTWATPADVTYGTALSSTQLNATSSVAGTITYSPASGNVPNAGDNTITASFTPTDSANYNSASTTRTLHVNKAPLTVTADNKSRDYGTPNPSLTATLSGFVNGDATSTATTGTAWCQTHADSNSRTAESPYPITCELGTLAASNYSFDTFVDGTLTVGNATLDAISDNKTKVFGEINPVLTVTLTGFHNGENPDSAGVTGAATCTTTAQQTSPVGTYPIVCSKGSLSSPDYSFGTFTDGTMTIVADPTTTAVSSSLNPSVFGQPFTLTAHVTANAPGAPAAGIPTGIVTFTDGNTTLGVGDLDGDGVARLTVPHGLSVGSHGIVATYSGSGSFVASDANVTQVVDRAPTITVAHPAGHAVVGFSERLSATLTRAFDGTPLSGQTITFTAGNEVCLGITDADGFASCSIAGLGLLGLLNLLGGGPSTSYAASFEGDGNYVPSSGTNSI